MEFQAGKGGENNMQETVMNVPEINSGEELDKLLNGTEVTTEEEPVETGKNKKPAEKVPAKPTKTNKDAIFNLEEEEEDEEEDEEEEEPTDKKPKKKEKLVLDNEEEEEEEEEDEEQEFDENKEYPTSIHYLNAKYKLGLNMKAVDPKKITRSEEAEVISDIFERMSNNARKTIGQFQQVAQVLQDEDVQMILQAKREGKTMKEIMEQYSQTIDGMTDEQLIENDYRRMHPKATPELVKKYVDTLKNTGDVKAFADNIRESRKNEETATAKQRQLQEKQRLADEQRQEVEDRKNFTRFVQGITNIYGIPVTPAMKQDIVRAATQRDNEGLTELDHYLQSDQGVALLSLAMTNLRTLLGSKKSILKAQGKASLLDKLTADPKELARPSSGKNRQQQDEISEEMINSFL